MRAGQEQRPPVGKAAAAQKLVKKAWNLGEDSTTGATRYRHDPKTCLTCNPDGVREVDLLRAGVRHHTQTSTEARVWVSRQLRRGAA